MPCTGNRTALISQLPLDVVGGGELYSINAFGMLVQEQPAAELWYSAQIQPALACHAQRMQAIYVRADLKSGRLVERERQPLCALLPRVSQFDMIVIHQYLSCSSTIDWIAACAPDQRAVLTSLGHEAFEADFGRVFEHGANAQVIEISDFAAERSRQRGVPATGICGGIARADVELDGCARQREFSRTRVATSIGRLLPHKGFDVTIRGLGQDWTLNIVGPPSGDQIYESLIAKLTKSNPGVSLRGYLPLKDRTQVLRDSDVLIASSCHTLYDGKQIAQAELFGLVLLEAVAAGVLPIASRIPSFTEIMTRLELEDWTYEERDVDGLRHKLDRVAQLSSEEYARQVQNAQHKLCRHFLWDDYWNRVLQAVGEKPKRAVGLAA